MIFEHSFDSYPLLLLLLLLLLLFFLLFFPFFLPLSSSIFIFIYLISALPIIVVYQTIGINPYWVVLWLVLWVGPLGVVFAMARHGWRRLEEGRRRPGLERWLAGLYFVGTAGLLGALIATELSQLHGENAGFLVALTLTSFVLTGSTVFCALTHGDYDGGATAEATKQLADILAEVQGEMGDAQRRGALGRLWDFVTEKAEAADMTLYGQRVPFRRVFLLLGLAAYTYIVATRLNFYLHVSAREQTARILDSLVSGGFTWPPDGMEILDEFFHVYNEARWTSLGIFLLAWVLLVLCAMLDMCWRHRAGLRVSRVLGVASLFVLFVGAIWPALPDYLASLHLEVILPKCPDAPQFNDLLLDLTGDTIGLVCAAFFAVNLLAVVLAVSPALVRSSKMILLDDRGSGSIARQARVLLALQHRQRQSQDAPASHLESDLLHAECALELQLAKAGQDQLTLLTDMLTREAALYMRNVQLVFALSSLLTPLLTTIPVLVIFQVINSDDDNDDDDDEKKNNDDGKWRGGKGDEESGG